MTSPGGAKAGSLKDQNRWQLWVIVAANSLFLYSVTQTNAIKAGGLHAAFTNARNLLPVGLALVISTVLNGLISADMKDRLVFLRWHHALPGHRAFGKYAMRDPRIDPSTIENLNGGLLPIDPVEQNRSWYRFYKAVENAPAVRQVHRDFLLLRDYAGLSAVFIAFYGMVALYAIPSLKIGLIYILLLIGQYAFARQAAANYGSRMVTTVLAQRAANETATSPPTTKKRARNIGPADLPKDQEQ